MPPDPQELIRRAFAKVKETGRPDWHRMSVAVLKNRLLDLTERTFRESDHGATTFLEFVRANSAILDVDLSQTPPIAILKEAVLPSGGEPISARTRIRSDLWWATLNFSGNEEYVWDLDEHAALRASEAAKPGPVIPTVTEELFSEWKNAFADTLEEDERGDRIEQWAERRLPASVLPAPVMHRWHEYLKKNVYARLLAWIEEQDLSVPEDLLDRPSAGAAVSPSGRSEELRRRLIACLRVMTDEELERVQIPSSVLLRTKP